jgi:hypothetical protein
MLSQDAQNLADWCLGFALRKEPILPHTATVLAQALMDFAEQAQHLENVPLHLDPPEVALPLKRKARTHAS